MNRILEFLKKLFKKIFKAVKKAIGWIMKNWKILALAFVLGVMFLTPAFLSSIGLSWFSGVATTVQTTLGVSSGWSLYAGIAAAGGAAILIAPEETAELISGVGSNIATVSEGVGSSVGSIISGAIGGLATGIVEGSLNSTAATIKSIALSPITWIAGAVILGYLFWPVKDKGENKSEVDTETATEVEDRLEVNTETAIVADQIGVDVSNDTIGQDITSTTFHDLDDEHISYDTVAQGITSTVSQDLGGELNQQDSSELSKTESLRFL